MEGIGLLTALVVAAIVLIATAGGPPERDIRQEQEMWDARIILDHEAAERHLQDDDNPDTPAQRE